MSEKRKKFSLGNIRRKLGDDLNLEEAKKRAKAEKTDKSNGDTDKTIPKPTLDTPNSHLPNQPRFGHQNFTNEEATIPALTQFDKKSKKTTSLNILPVEESASYEDNPVVSQSPPRSSPPQPPSDLESSISGDLEEEEEEFDIYRYISILLRRKAIIILSSIAFGLFSLFNYLTAPKQYAARARLLFSPGHREIVSDNLFSYQMWQDREKKVNTHLELLKSDFEVLRRVSENLEDRVTPNEIQSGITIIRGETDGEKNNIIELGFKHPDSLLARDVVNTLCKEYISYIEEVSAQDITKMIFKFKDQIEKVTKQLDHKEEALRNFKEKNRMVQLTSETNLIISKLSNMELALQQTQLDLLENKEKFTSIKQQINQQEINVVNAITYEDPYQSRLSELQFQLNSLLAEYSEDHFKVKMVEKEIAKMKEVIQSNVKTKTVQSETYIKNPIRESLLQNLVTMTIDKSSLEAKRMAQEQIIEKLNGELKDLPALELEYASLKRGTESLVQTLVMLEDKYEKAKIKRDSQESDLKILELAQTPSIPFSTVKRSRIIIGIFIGVILGIALAFLFEFLDQTIKEPRDLEKALELPLLGIVPQLEEDKPVIDPTVTKNKTKLEPFRVLRTNLKHIAKVHNIRSLIICSPVKGEGKTTLAANLAITFAMDGKKIVLVDGDLRRPQIHGLLNLNKEMGLSDYILELADVDEIIKPTQHENLSIITSGERPDNPTELLGTIRFDKLLAELRQRFDLVLFDSPALLPVSDAINMAPKMDGCVLIGRNLWTPLKAAKQAKMQLKQIGTKILGVILNGISHSRGYYPYYYGYYRYYAYKYTYDYEEDRKSKSSLREFGLKFESKLKESAQNLTSASPRYIAQSGRFLGYLGKKWLFWLLLIVFISLTMFSGWIRSQKKRIPPEEKIEFLGAQTEFPLKEMGKNTDLRNESQGIPLESFQSPNSVASHLKGFRTYNSEIKKPLSLNANLQKWHLAIKEKDSLEINRYYDNINFKYPDGGYKRWQSDVQNDILELSDTSKITIDSSWTEVIDEIYAKAFSIITFLSISDTTKLKFVQIWGNTTGKWKIVREKHNPVQ